MNLYSAAGAAACSMCNGILSSDATTCTPCAAGTKYSEFATTKCVSCPSGQVASSGQSSCTACASGLVANAAQSACEPCPAGSFYNSGSCSSCPVGFTSSVGALNGLACVQCKAGQTTNSTNACVACPAGKYCPSQKATAYGGFYGDVYVPTCPDGSYSRANASSLSDCIGCFGGIYNSSGSCNPCGKNYYSTFVGSNVDSSGYRCNSCPGNSLSPANSSGASSCIRCAGFINATDGTCVSKPSPPHRHHQCAS